MVHLLVALLRGFPRVKRCGTCKMDLFARRIMLARLHNALTTMQHKQRRRFASVLLVASSDRVFVGQNEIEVQRIALDLARY